MVEKGTENNMPGFKLEGYENLARNREILKVDAFEKAHRRRVTGKQSESTRLARQPKPGAVRRRLRSKQSDPLHDSIQPQHRFRIVGKQPAQAWLLLLDELFVVMPQEASTQSSRLQTLCHCISSAFYGWAL